MHKNKTDIKVQPIQEGIERNFKLEDMTVYSELVRIIGESNHTYYPSEGKFYWTLALENCEFVEIEIILTSEPNNTILEIYEVEPEKHGTQTINHDLIYTLIGYACAKQIELKYNEYLHIKGNKY